MNLGKQIKEYRQEYGYSQEELAHKIYVSRQTISNWETDKSYPDIQNILLLSAVFDVSLDEFVQGDLEMIKQKLSKNQKNTEMNKHSYIMLISMVLSALSYGVVIVLDRMVWMILPFLLLLPGVVSAFKIEKWKKRENIKTYSEILAFTEGGNIERQRRQRNKVSYFLKKSALFLFLQLLFC